MDLFHRLSKDTDKLKILFFEILFYLFILFISIMLYNFLDKKATNKSPQIFYKNKTETSKKEIYKRYSYKVVNNNQSAEITNRV